MNITSNPQLNPMLRETENVSPAISLDLVCGYEQDGWPIYTTYRVGDVVVTTNGKLRQILGFTLDNQVIAHPYGFDAIPGVSIIVYKPEGLIYLPE